jgi:hypothetical protein
MVTGKDGMAQFQAIVHTLGACSSRNKVFNFLFDKSGADEDAFKRIAHTMKLPHLVVPTPPMDPGLKINAVDAAVARTLGSHVKLCGALSRFE